jgi:hypothetical protein
LNNAKCSRFCREKITKLLKRTGMESSVRMSVFFHCPNPACGMIYGATRDKRPKQQTGRFACVVCESEVLRWSDYYDFSDWLLVTKPPTSWSAREAAAAPMPASAGRR